MARTSMSLPFDRHKLRNLREDRRLRQQDLADRSTALGTPTSRHQVVRYEAGKSKPSRDHLNVFAVVLEVPVRGLLDDQVDESLIGAS